MKKKTPKQPSKTRKFFNDVLLSSSTTSSKRLVTLLFALHLILTSFLYSFVSIYMIFYLPKGKIDTDLLGLLKDILEYDFYIILSGLGFVTAEGVVSIIVEKSKAKIASLNTFVNTTPPPYVPEGETKDRPIDKTVDEPLDT